MRLLITAAVLCSLPLIHGCAAVAIGGAAAGGYMVGEERRTAGTLTNDQTIEFRISNRVTEKYPNSHVNSTAYNRMVLLTGEAPSAEAKADIEKIARSVPDVRDVYNELTVAPASPLSARATDTYLTSKVKTRFVDNGKFNPLHVKVVTERETVYLMGLVKRPEADAATQIARTTPGVKRVVRVFEYQE
ncbi:MAG TPA: BON domain-containing protein [Burkholderiales bacterium]|nr:BON domain-containing protein [Burkholderiales bacterium]